MLGRLIHLTEAKWYGVSVFASVHTSATAITDARDRVPELPPSALEARRIWRELALSGRSTTGGSGFDGAAIAVGECNQLKISTANPVPSLVSTI